MIYFPDSHMLALTDFQFSLYWLLLHIQKKVKNNNDSINKEHQTEKCKTSNKIFSYCKRKKKTKKKHKDEKLKK